MKIEDKNIEDGIQTDCQKEAILDKNKFQISIKSALKVGDEIKDVIESVADTTDKIVHNTDKIGKNVSKISKKIKTTSSDIINSVKEINYTDIADNIKDKVEVVTMKTKEIKESTKNVVSVDQMTTVLNVCYENAVNGIPGVSKSVKNFADEYRERYKDPKKAATELVKYQIFKCTTSGFITSFGGVITMPVTLPANITSVLYVQIRMIAAIAYIAGYNINDDEVQTLVFSCLTGQAVTDIIKDFGVKFGIKTANAGVAKISGKTLTKINQAVGYRLITKFGSKGLINLGKAVPVVGAVVGGGFDYYSTKIIAGVALDNFVFNQM